jgi:hypothetical protein
LNCSWHKDLLIEKIMIWLKNKIILNNWNHIMLRFSKVESIFFCYIIRLYCKIVEISNLNDNLHLKKLNLCVYVSFACEVHQQQGWWLLVVLRGYMFLCFRWGVVGWRSLCCIGHSSLKNWGSTLVQLW